MTPDRHGIRPVLELLVSRWPACFSIFEQHRKPLKIGIHADSLMALDGAVTVDKLSIALACYVANKAYRAKLIAGAIRVGLDGAPAGIVTEKQAARPASKPAARTNSTPPANMPITTPKRLSLADLRAAAAARRKVAAS
jgi:ProP effector